MTGCGQRRKTKSRFSSAAHEPLEIAGAIPTFPQPRPLPPWKSGNPKAGFPLSHGDFPLLKQSKNQNQKEINPSVIPSFFRLISRLENAAIGKSGLRSSARGHATRTGSQRHAGRLQPLPAPATPEIYRPLESLRISQCPPRGVQIHCFRSSHVLIVCVSAT
jgi:hypothetical protein